jgi:hypothetical protein
MLRLSSRVSITDAMVVLADSIQFGEDTQETLGALMSKELAQYAVEMTAATLSVKRLISCLVSSGGDTGEVGLALALVFLCAIARIWKQHVLESSKKITFEMLQLAGFAAFVFTPSALARVLPLPSGGIYEFLLRVEAGPKTTTNEHRSWFQYIFTCHGSKSETISDDVLKAILTHPSTIIAEFLVKICTDTKMPIDVYSGDVVKRLLKCCLMCSRRRRRSASAVDCPRARAITTMVCSWIHINTFVAFLTRDFISNDVLVRANGDTINFEQLGTLVLAVQRRLPYIPFSEDTLCNVPEEIRSTSTNWTSIFDAIRRLPPAEDRVDHPVWEVRRHY